MGRTCHLLGAPVQSGAGLPGCQMGPESLRTAGLVNVLQQLDWEVTDLGDIGPDRGPAPGSPNPVLHNLAETADWIRTLSRGSIRGRTELQRAGLHGRGPQHVRRHGSGNGTPCGRYRPAAVCTLAGCPPRPPHPGIDDQRQPAWHASRLFHRRRRIRGLPALVAAVDPKHLMMMGIRSVDPAESQRIQDLGMDVVDMRAIDEHGVVAPIRSFLNSSKQLAGICTSALTSISWTQRLRPPSAQLFPAARPSAKRT